MRQFPGWGRTPVCLPCASHVYRVYCTKSWQSLPNIEHLPCPAGEPSCRLVWLGKHNKLWWNLADKSLTSWVEVHGFKSWEADWVFICLLFDPILWFLALWKLNIKILPTCKLNTEIFTDMHGQNNISDMLVEIYLLLLGKYLWEKTPQFWIKQPLLHVHTGIWISLL